MKKILKITTLIILISINIISWLNYLNAADDSSSSSVIRNQDDNYVDLCKFWEDRDWRCTLDRWIVKIEDKVKWIEKERNTLEYAQDIIWYLLWFIYIIATIYIIYAWFLLLMWTWDIIASWKARSNIIYVLVWVTVIYLADSIVRWLISILS